MTDNSLLKTPLHALHVERGAKMVPFAGYDMPVQYPLGVMAEHNWTREKAGLFDVSHMGQAVLVGPDHETTASALEALTPGVFLKLKPGRQKYTMLLSDEGGVLDDLMAARPLAPEADGRINIIVNAACKEQDYAHISARLPENVSLERFDDRGLLALQGPKAAAVFAKLSPGADEMTFMSMDELDIGGIKAIVTRSGYTGEDGYEISTRGEDTEALARMLLTSDDVELIGLGARDSLRLEAGLCLYGHDLDPSVSPVEANLNWAIGKRRREDGGFPGADRVQTELAAAPVRKLVGIKPGTRAPAREGTIITDAQGKEIGVITSGGFGPTYGGPVAMGFVSTENSDAGTTLNLMIRGKSVPAEIVELPFVPHRYYRG